MPSQQASAQQPHVQKAKGRDRYRWVAPFYDVLAHCYSLGAISRSKHGFVSQVSPGQRVLIVGAGRGGELAALLERGAQITVVDSSPSMLRAIRKRGGGTPALEVFEGNLADYTGQNFDHISAPYFLNIFSTSQLPVVFEHLARHLNKNGSLWISDFSPAKSRIGSLPQQVYFAIPLIVFAVLSRNAWHGLRDYGLLAVQQGWQQQGYQEFSITGLGPAWFAVWQLRTP